MTLSFKSAAVVQRRDFVSRCVEVPQNPIYFLNPVLVVDEQPFHVSSCSQLYIYQVRFTAKPCQALCKRI